MLLVLLIIYEINKLAQKQKNREGRYIQNFIDTDNGINKGELADTNFLVLNIDAHPGANFDVNARTYLEEAQSKVREIKGVYIVDVKDCHFGDGWVTGERIGKAFK